VRLSKDVSRERIKDDFLHVYVLYISSVRQLLTVSGYRNVQDFSLHRRCHQLRTPSDFT
jgi:hypothetical protein